MEINRGCDTLNLPSLIRADRDFDDIQELIQYLECERGDDQINSNLHIVATLSMFQNINQFVETLKNFHFSIDKRAGKLLLLSKESQGKRIYIYTFFDDRNNVPLFITDAKKTNEIPDILFTYINRTKEISNLWIAPKVMKEIKDNLVREHPDMIITYFSAKRSPNTDIHSEFRPHVERGIQYRGNDGKHTLEEMEFYYGVLPKILEVQLPNGIAFRIDNKGIITLRHGHFAGIFKIIEDVVSRLENVREAIGESGYSISKVGSRRQFSNAIQIPWSIDVPVEMHYDDVSRFCKAVRSEEWNFTVLEQVLLPGSMFFSARLIDEHTGSLLDISTTGKKIDVYPVEKIDIGTSMRFFEFVVENIDHMATVG
ncbi:MULTISPECIES: hypothetical protein [Methanoculleus]|uniref:Uncharacterized protein n=1 Tax=Methanoculleus methanifontis TaxID=2584086 RepID=A0ABT8M4B0_9EURY|nr:MULTISPECIES: hypothetical protein [unclassified Methanoculleus]KDE54402.1 hypothetical protein EI28_02365 [Methanoculleus sp. MH98A]MDN7013427.1 hypothetical protein [Methanoculleus sp. FWC-SCC3]